MLLVEDSREMPISMASTGFHGQPQLLERVETGPILEASCEDIPGKDMPPSSGTDEIKIRKQIQG